MGKLIVFNMVSLDGYFVDADNDMSWAHSDDPEWQGFTQGNARGEGILLFGRVTYQMMAGWWPTPAALEAYPEVAQRMNHLPKVVFSRTMDRAEWNNTRLVKTDPAAEVRAMKRRHDGMTVMGSGRLVALLAQEGLVDEFHVVVCPLVLGKGRTMFEGVTRRLSLKMEGSRVFSNGKTLLRYAPA